MRITVVGAGAWGTALAVACSARHEVLLFARDTAQAERMASERVNATYLPGAALPASLAVSSDWQQAVSHVAGADPGDAAAPGLWILATPVAALREVLQRLPAQARFLWLCKGFERASGLLPHEVVAQVVAQRRAEGLQWQFGALSGPSFASEVSRALPTALVAACNSDALAESAVQALHGAALRIYTSRDLPGVEVGGAVKNVLAVATGISDGLALGLNARAALITRGLAEMTRLGLALGGEMTTFMGLAGLGDLVLTATGDLSRNRQVGLALARGEALPQILARLGHVAEGVACAPTVLARAKKLGVDMPLTEAVVDVLNGAATPQDAAQRLMARDARGE